MACFIFIGILTACQISLLLGCGITTHIETAERASEFFQATSLNVDYNRLINRNADAFQAGAPYPDAFYPDFCFGGNYHQVAEDTHWTPFAKVAIEYIRREYTRPWDRDAEKLVVFLLSLIQHQVADATWHSLGIDQGFLDTMAKVNYHNSFGDAHSAGDFGGDVLNVYELDMEYVGTLAKWYVPVDDLLNIYEDLYNGMSPMRREIIENCTFIMFMGRLGEQLGAIDLLYPLIAANSPFILDSLNDYYLGGIDDMAVWCQNVWWRTITMLDNGTSVCDLPDNPIYIRCNDERYWSNQNHVSTAGNSRVKREARTNAVNKWFDAVGDRVDPDSIEVTRSGRGIYYSAEKVLMQAIEKRLRSTSRGLTTCEDEDPEEPTTFYSTRVKYSRLGEFMTSGDINNDGYEDVIISAPGFSSSGNYQQGRVYIVYGDSSGVPSTNLQLELRANQMLNGIQMNSRFGSAVVSVDVNLDGLNDLVVSAPSYGSPSLDYYGQVYVYLSTARGQPLPSQPSIVIDCTQQELSRYLSPLPAVSSLMERYCNFGFTLARGDVNEDGHDDVIIGSPFAPAGGRQRGMVGVIYSSATLRKGAVLTQADFDWRFNGEQEYQWAGYSLSAGRTTGGSTILLVGAPSSRICASDDCQFNRGDVQAVGKTFIFKSPAQSITPLTSVVGSEEFEQLGAHVLLTVWNDIDVIIISSISADVADADTVNGRGLVQAGTVNFYRLINNDEQVESEPFLTLSGDRDLSRFGSSVIVYSSPEDGRSSVIVAAPYRSQDLTEDREGGRVYVFNDFSIEAHQPNRTISVFTQKSRFGSSIATVNSNNGNKIQLLIGAQHFAPPSTLLVQYRLEGTVGLVDLYPQTSFKSA